LNPPNTKDKRALTNYTNAEALECRGRAYAKLGEQDKAVADYSRGMEMLGDHAGLLNSLAWNLADHPDPKVRDPRRAVVLAEKAVALGPKVKHFWNTLGWAYYRTGKWRAALEALAKSVEHPNVPDDSWSMFAVAMAHWQLGDRSKAREAYDQSVKLMNSSGSLHNEQLRGYHVEAAALLSMPIPTPPAVEQGRTYVTFAQWDQAATCYGKATAYPAADGGHVGFEQASVFLLAGDQTGYRRTCSQLLEMYGRMQKPRGFLVARTCILAPQPIGDLTLAEKAAASELKNNRGGWVLTASAGLHYRAGRYPQAAELLHQCLDEYPAWDGKVLDWLWLALTYHQLGKEIDAKQWLHKSTQWLDKHPTLTATEDSVLLHLHDWLEAQVLRREAEALITGKNDLPEK
jgi:tetratricopeptide (TPR) repeat protein